MDHTRAPMLEALTEFRRRGDVTFGPPGHKQGKGTDPRVLEILGEALFADDVLSLNGLDDRRQSQGVLSQAQDLMADAVGAEQCFFSTCGSSLSVKSALISVAGPREMLGVAPAIDHARPLTRSRRPANPAATRTCPHSGRADPLRWRQATCLTGRALPPATDLLNRAHPASSRVSNLLSPLLRSSTIFGRSQSAPRSPARPPSPPPRATPRRGVHPSCRCLRCPRADPPICSERNRRRSTRPRRRPGTIPTVDRG